MSIIGKDEDKKETRVP